MTNNPTQRFEASAQLFKALAHPARLAILDILREGEQCVCHLEAVLKFRQAYLSQQLAVLREAGILQDRREGWNIYYRIVRKDVLDILHTIHSSLPDQPTPVIAHSCECPKCKRKDRPTNDMKSFLMTNQAG